jgi:RNA polymerase sigma-70 factor, ECF subfamily
MQWDGVHGLVQRARAGDQEAWDRLVVMVQPYLLQTAHGLVRTNGPDRSYQDLTQETWIRAWRGLHDFRGGGDDAQTAALLRAWLRSILKRVASNIHRADTAQRRKMPPGTVRLDGARAGDSTGHVGTTELAADASTPSANLRAEECRDRIGEALARLADPKDREIVRLQFFEGLSLTRIAERLGLTLDEVRGRFHASLRHLEPWLRDLR